MQVDDRAVEISVVMPCLNEADTIRACVAKAQQGLDDCPMRGEVIVADNGSHDGSQAMAREMGARVVNVEARGYGNALMGGIAAAQGRYIVMGDADDSYDFREIAKFIGRLQEGADLVMGCRLPSGGGRIMPGAMPFLHKWVGNPLFTTLARWWFQVPTNDVYCGLRAFTRNIYDTLDLRCTGMEFATEMIIKASLYGAAVSEVPIVLHADGRKSHAPHLRTFNDGWRTLRFFLMYCPRWLFLIPGLLLILAGLTGYGIAMPGLTLGGITFDAHTLLFSSLAIICGYQSILFGIMTRIFAVAEKLVPDNPNVSRLLGIVTLERALAAGLAAMAIGILLLLGAIDQWREVDFGNLDYKHTMRWVIPGVSLTTLGFQTVLSAFFISILNMKRR